MEANENNLFLHKNLWQQDSEICMAMCGNILKLSYILPILYIEIILLNIEGELEKNKRNNDKIVGNIQRKLWKTGP